MPEVQPQTEQLYFVSELPLLMRDMKRLKVDVAALSQVGRPGSDLLELHVTGDA